LVRRNNRVAVLVVQFELAWSNFRVVLFVFESKRSLGFGEAVDKCSKLIVRERVVVAAARYDLETF
jgi:hypothetical protein